MNFVEFLFCDEGLVMVIVYVMDYVLGDDVFIVDVSGKCGSFSIIEFIFDIFGFVFGIVYQDQFLVQ